MNHPFKTGDKVVAIDNYGGYVTAGRVYTVSSVTALSGDPRVLIEGEYDNGFPVLSGLSARKFRAAIAGQDYPAPASTDTGGCGGITSFGYGSGGGGPPARFVEADPTGKGANEPGAKLDAGKLRPALVLGGFANALEAVVKVGTDGAKKYTDNGWLQVPDGFNRYDEAQRRHTLKRDKGEVHDPDSGSLHLSHEAWNALAKLELYLRSKQ